MKKFLSILTLCALIGALLLSASSCGERNDTIDSALLKGEYNQDLAGTTLKVYNWGEYISDGTEGSLDVNAAFENLTGIEVVYLTYDDNETMYSDLVSGANYYDIIIPSDYMIERLIREDRLETVDVESLSNYQYIDEQYKNLYFDPNNEYSVPYNVGMVGLIYNTTMVEGTIDSWEALWDETYSGNILTFNNPRDAFALAQLILGQDLNTTNHADWDAAAELLKEQSSVLQARVMDEVFNKMEGGNAALAPYYAGDYLLMKENNPDLAFVYPKEGVNIFCDSVCIPKGCQNYEAAMLYMNFLMEPEIALANAEALCYASPNTEVVSHEDYTYKDNEILYPSEEDMPEVQWFHDLDAETVEYYEALWIEVTNS
ncbi:MAG: spermidine/putrescine ABC transporter substrate-binding protein [Clostridiales bacterium]|nr:spermidine/putrescine ABC transporter substrate-binding protein [Clostridiales bacterium]